LTKGYAPSPVRPIVADLFRERPEYKAAGHPLRCYDASHEPDGGWQRWTGRPLRVHWLESPHLEVMKGANAGQLAAAIRAAMDAHYGL
jgi:thioesterase domain-containing protein